MKKIIALLLLSIMVFTCFVSCGEDDEKDSEGITYHTYAKEADVTVEGGKYNTALTGEGTEVDMTKVSAEIDSFKYENFAVTDEMTDFVVIRVKGYGDIVLALRPDIAPYTVQNFKNLVAEDFYSGLIFHRVFKNFMIQGGGMDAEMNDKDSESVYGEFAANGHTNNLSHIAGVLAMARANDVNSGSSQFYITHVSYPSLDGQYASFGYVLAGKSVVDSIAECQTGVRYVGNYPMEDVPVENIFIEDAFFVKPIKGANLAVAE